MFRTADDHNSPQSSSKQKSKKNWMREKSNNTPSPPHADKKYVYNDFSSAKPLDFKEAANEPSPRTLPAKLNSMLSDPALSDIIAWQPHGRSWRILDRDRFSREVLPTYFEHSNYNSFVRLVNAWGFRRVPHGVDGDSHYHELFLRGMPHLHAKMRRTALNERKVPIEPKNRCPNFAAMPPLPVSGIIESGKSDATILQAGKLNAIDSVPILPSASLPTAGNDRQIQNVSRGYNVAAMGLDSVLSSMMLFPSALSQNSATQVASAVAPPSVDVAKLFPPQTYYFGGIHNSKLLFIPMAGSGQQISGLQPQQYQMLMMQLLLHQQQLHQHQHQQQNNLLIGQLHQAANQQYTSMFLAPSQIPGNPMQMNCGEIASSPGSFELRPCATFPQTRVTGSNLQNSIINDGNDIHQFVPAIIVNRSTEGQQNVAISSQFQDGSQAFYASNQIQSFPALLLLEFQGMVAGNTLSRGGQVPPNQIPNALSQLQQNQGHESPSPGRGISKIPMR